MSKTTSPRSKSPSPPSSRRLFPPTNERKRTSHLDVAETVDQGHGRTEHRRLQASTRLAGQADWPGLAQVLRLTHKVTRGGSTTTDTVYAITSVPREQADAAKLLDWHRGHWGIENRLHYVRDVTLDEDACRIRTGAAPQNLAALRNAMITLLRLEGHTNIAAGLRAFAWQTHRLLAMLGILKN